MNGRPVRRLTSEEILGIHAHIAGNGAFDINALRRATAAVVQVNELGEEVNFELFTMASAYLTDLIDEEPFEDYNEVVAWESTTIFLRLNGISIQASADEIDALLQNAMNGAAGENEISDFLADHATYFDPPSEPRSLW